MDEIFEPQKPSINLSNKEHDFSGWFSEKSNTVLRELSYITDCIKKIKQGENRTPYSYEDELDDCLSFALVDIVKMVSIINGCEQAYSKDDFLLICDNGYNGYKELMRKYGMPAQEDILERVNRLDDDKIRAELGSFVGGDRSNRSVIHSLLVKIRVKTEQEKAMENDIEMVTMNEKSWEWFVDKYKGYQRK